MRRGVIILPMGGVEVAAAVIAVAATAVAVTAVVATAVAEVIRLVAGVVGLMVPMGAGGILLAGEVGEVIVAVGRVLLAMRRVVGSGGLVGISELTILMGVEVLPVVAGVAAVAVGVAVGLRLDLVRRGVLG